MAGKSSDTQCAFRKLWKKYGGVFIKRMCIELAMEAREGPDPEGKAEFHMAATGHLFQDLMATCHPPVMLDDVAETSSNTQCAFRQLLTKYGGVFIGREPHVH